MPLDPRGQFLSQFQEAIGIVPSERMDPAFEKLEQVADDLHVSEPQLIEGERFGTRSPAAGATVFFVEDPTLSSQGGTTLGR
jgi:hypothetical protein